MANDYFDSEDYTPPSKLTLARSEHIRDLASAVVSGFNKLPSARALTEGRVTYAEASGEASVYTIELETAPTEYTEGMEVTWVAPVTCIGASTVNIIGPQGSGLGAMPIKRFDGTDLAAGDIVSGMVVKMTSKGSDGFQMTTILGGIAGTGLTADPELVALANLESAADTLPYFTGSGLASLATFTNAARTLLAAANAAAMRVVLGLGSMSTRNSIDGADWSGQALDLSNGGTGASNSSSARAALGVAIGSDVQAYDATLSSLAGLGTGAGKFAYTTGVDTWAEGTITAAGRALIDDASVAAQRATLGLLPAGTQMLFIQTAAPVGWTKITAHNDKALRVVSGTVTSGGTLGFSQAFAPRTVSGVVSGTALAAINLPPHNHYIAAAEDSNTSVVSLASDNWLRRAWPVAGNSNGYGLQGTYNVVASVGLTSTVGSGVAHGHGLTMNTFDMSVKYVDSIIASKD